MRMQRLLASTLVLLAATVSSGLPRSAAEEESAAPVQLRFAPEPGTAIEYRVHMDGAQTLTVDGKDAVTMYDTTTDLRLVFDEVGTDGKRRARLRYESIRGWMEPAGKDRLEFDSAEPLPTEPELLAATMAFTALAGNEFSLTFDRYGEVLQVDGVREVVRKLAGKGPQSGARRTFFARLIRRDSIQEQLSWYLLVTPLPREALARGEGWNDKDDVPGLSGFRSEASLTHRMVSSASGVARVATRGKLTVEATRPELRGGLVVKRATLDAKSRVAAADGLPLSVHSTLQMELSLPTQKAKVRQTTRFEVIRSGGVPAGTSTAQER
jgi:hypothetical protein